MMPSHRDHDDPIEVSKKSRFTLPLTVICSIVVAAYVLGQTYSGLKESDHQLEATSQAHAVLLADHEARIRHLESIDASLDEIKRMLAVRRESSKVAQP